MLLLCEYPAYVSGRGRQRNHGESCQDVFCYLCHVHLPFRALPRFFVSFFHPRGYLGCANEVPAGTAQICKCNRCSASWAIHQAAHCCCIQRNIWNSANCSCTLIRFGLRARSRERLGIANRVTLLHRLALSSTATCDPSNF